MKTCSRCQEVKMEVDFRKDSSRSDGLHISCKTCIKKRDKELYYDRHKHKVRDRTLQIRSANKVLLEQYKSSLSCLYCGENESVCLDFHHKDPGTKEFGIANNLSRNWDKIKQEIDKCICVCSNCHRKIHAGII